jgi:hypothetical protein
MPQGWSALAVGAFCTPFPIRSGLGILIAQEGHDIGDFPHPVRYTSGHRRRNTDRLMDADEIKVHEVQRDRRDVVLELL